MLKWCFRKGFPHLDYSDQIRNYFCTVFFAQFFSAVFVAGLQWWFGDGFPHQDSATRFAIIFAQFFCTVFVCTVFLQGWNDGLGQVFRTKIQRPAIFLLSFFCAVFFAGLKWWFRKGLPHQDSATRFAIMFAPFFFAQFFCTVFCRAEVMV